MNQRGQLTIQNLLSVPVLLITFMVFIIMFNAIWPTLDNQMVNMTYYSIQKTLLLLIPFIVVIMIIASIWMVMQYRQERYV